MRICQRSPPRARTGTDSLHNNRHLLGTRLIAIDMRGQRGPRNQKRRRLRRRRMRLPPGGFENDTRGEDGGRVPAVRIRRAAPRNQKRRRLRRRRTRLPPGGFENDTRGEDGGRVSAVRIRRAARETRSGAARATPPYTLVPPGGFEPSTPALGERCSIP